MFKSEDTTQKDEKKLLDISDELIKIDRELFKTRAFITSPLRSDKLSLYPLILAERSLNKRKRLLICQKHGLGNRLVIAKRNTNTNKFDSNIKIITDGRANSYTGVNR